MDNHSKKSFPSKAEIRRQTIDAHWQSNDGPLLLESPQGRFPCDSLPLVQAVCGCRSPGLILASVTDDNTCPLGRPFGCPIRRSPVL